MKGALLTQFNETETNECSRFLVTKLEPEDSEALLSALSNARLQNVKKIH